MKPIKPPKPKLKPGVIYSADNGRLICLDCAGKSALYTKRDISGQLVQAVPPAQTAEWFKVFGEPMSCERGCTTYPLTSGNTDPQL
jgi:hypothetical protein